jgi:hypothetical protein
MSKNGKLKKARNVEKRRLQMEEALECLPLKEPALAEIIPFKKPVQQEQEPLVAVKREPKQCSYAPCARYVDPSCAICPYCGNPL